MPNNKKKRMSFGSSSKATNKVKKTKVDATLMEKKMLPRAKKIHSKDKDKEEKNRKVYELSVEQSSRSKLYVDKITRKVKVDNPCIIFMTEASIDNQFKLDQEKVKGISNYCKVGANHAKSVIVCDADFNDKEEDTLNKLSDWWQEKSQTWGIRAVGGEFSNTVMLRTKKAIKNEFHKSMKGEDKKSKKYLREFIEHSGLAKKLEEHEGNTLSPNFFAILLTSTSAQASSAIYVTNVQWYSICALRGNHLNEIKIDRRGRTTVY